jgi:hypothetical protein
MTKLYLHLKENDDLSTVIYENENNLFTILEILEFSLK